MGRLSRTIVARLSLRDLAVVGVTVGVLLLGGCAETIEQYARFGAWSRSPKEPMVFSGTPSRDAAAHGASMDVLTEHDWKVLEKIAPRPIWERIAELREQFMADRGRVTSRPAEEDKPDPVGDALKLAVDVPTTRLPDGKVQMYYRLRHYGGVGVTSARDGGTDRRKITLAAANLAPLLAIVTAQLGEKGTVAALPGENTLVITCDPAVQQSVLTLLAGIDVPPRQVEIGARIFEVDHDFDFQIGAETVLDHISNSTNYQSFESGFSTQSFIESLSSSPVPYQGSVLEVMKLFRDAGVSVKATFHALADAGLIRVVAAPRMTVTVGKTGYMLAGQELPVQSARFQAEQILTEKTSYKPVGVQLYITPLVVGPESVKLHVVTIVSAVSGFRNLTSMSQAEQVQGILNPVIDSREAETFVTVENEATLVIGGLRMIRTITRERKVPVLGDLKLLEWFFKSHRSQNQVNDLYFFITPRLIKTNRRPAAKPVAVRPLRPAPALLPAPVSARIAVPGRAPAPSPKPAPKPAPATQPAPKPPAAARQTNAQ